MKLARQYFVEKGEPSRGRIIARKQSYHGNTIGALSAGGNAWRRAQFGPLLIDVSHIDPCYEYRLREAGETLEAYGLRAANALETELLRVGPENVMAFMAEPVVGATAGALTAAPGYFRRIRRGHVWHGADGCSFCL
jgi:adenosylmethionine-8-amino-7-oxononanoate aminotransferase